MRVVWTKPADEDRDRIVLFIAQSNPQAAVEIDTLFTAAADSLANLPFRARQGRLPGSRELVVHKNYILVYGVDEKAETVHIDAVLHTSRLWPPD